MKPLRLKKKYKSTKVNQISGVAECHHTSEITKRPFLFWRMAIYHTSSKASIKFPYKINDNPWFSSKGEKPSQSKFHPCLLNLFWKTINIKQKKHDSQPFKTIKLPLKSLKNSLKHTIRMKANKMSSLSTLAFYKQIPISTSSFVTWTGLKNLIASTLLTTKRETSASIWLFR